MLDKDKPFNEVFGTSGIAFMQDDKCYLQSGEECDSEGMLIEAPKPKTKATKKAAPDVPSFK